MHDHDRVRPHRRPASSPPGPSAGTGRPQFRLVAADPTADSVRGGSPDETAGRGPESNAAAEPLGGGLEVPPHRRRPLDVQVGPRLPEGYVRAKASIPLVASLARIRSRSDAALALTMVIETLYVDFHVQLPCGALDDAEIAFLLPVRPAIPRSSPRRLTGPWRPRSAPRTCRVECGTARNRGSAPSDAASPPSGASPRARSGESHWAHRRPRAFHVPQTASGSCSRSRCRGFCSDGCSSDARARAYPLLRFSGAHAPAPTMTPPTAQDTSAGELPLQQLDRVVIRFAGDSGDGMQVTGNQFTRTSALFGNDLATLPDFPAEIRAPVGHAAPASPASSSSSAPRTSTRPATSPTCSSP